MVKYIATKLRALCKELLQKVGPNGGNIMVRPLPITRVLVKQNILKFGCDALRILGWLITITEQSIAVILDTVLGELVEIELHLPVKIGFIWLSGNKNHAGVLDSLERCHFL
jgi:hypothetical protein